MQVILSIAIILITLPFVWAVFDILNEARKIHRRKMMVLDEVFEYFSKLNDNGCNGGVK